MVLLIQLDLSREQSENNKGKKASKLIRSKLLLFAVITSDTGNCELNYYLEALKIVTVDILKHLTESFACKNSINKDPVMEVPLPSFSKQ